MTGEPAHVPARRRGPGRTVAVLGALAALVAGGGLFYAYIVRDGAAGPLPPYAAPGRSRVDAEAFVGSERCGDCHADVYGRWATSTHGRAGGPPSPRRLLPAFDGRPIRFSDATATPLRLPDAAYAFVVAWAGGTDTLRVEGVVGGGHMVGGGTQGFFTRHADGTLRFLPFDWSRHEGAWFCNARRPTPGAWRRITPDTKLSACADWPPRRILGHVQGSANCDTCHGSQIQIRFDPSSGHYETRYRSLDINCESCHGPGRDHVDAVTSGTVLSREDLGLASLATLGEDASLETCFRCHATRLVLHEGDLPGQSLTSSVSLLLPLMTDRPFLPDNRVGTFAYQLNHRGSGCYLDGSMTCTSCHEPHGQTYQDEYGRTLRSRFDDGQCLACHQSKAASPEAHTFHRVTSDGSRCVACHMPYLQHRSIGDDIRYARSDHTIPVPRPGLDARLGVTSACAGCHADRPPEALARQVREWYGELKPRRPEVEALVRASSVSDPAAGGALLLAPGAGFAMAQASGIGQYILRFVRPDDPPQDPDAQARLRALAADPDLDVRSLALAGLHLGWGSDPEVRAFLATRLTRDPAAGRVRDRWAAALRYVGDAYRLRGAPAEATTAYRRALDAVPDHPVTLEGLGLTLLDAGSPAAAVDVLRRAIALDPGRSTAVVGLARGLRDQGRGSEATATLEAAAERLPFDPRIWFALGNDRLARRALAGAGEAFTRAIELDAGLAPPRLGLAQVLAARGDLEGARGQVALALDFEPGSVQARLLLDRLGRP